MVKKYTAQIDDIIAVNEKRLIALARQSTQELVDQTQLSIGKGGRMRVDTGFLRASGQMSLTGLPTGPIRGDQNQEYKFDGNTTVTALSKFQLGNSVFFGWTANYAEVREIYDGFLGSAVQNWQSIVNDVTNRIRVQVIK